MTPFYFGSGARRLFGIYEPAAVGGMGKRAAVLCPPWGGEYVLAHRALRRLAIRLSAAGFHTLRFDFFGTGDSAGDMVDADLAGWEADTELAMRELRDIAAATRVTLIGLRLGATIAAQVAARHAGDVDALVLWDPVLSGSGYPPGAATAATGADQTVEFQGFPLTATMRREMRSIELGPLLAAPATRSLLAITDRHPLHSTLLAVPARPGAGSLAIEFVTDVHPWVWRGPPDFAGAVPVRVIERIVGWLR
jgi:pimeloyl-ACP methyl ester carboxylesterase